MKRVSENSYQSQFADEEIRARMKQQNLLQEYLELQKEFISKKKKLQRMQQKKHILLAEVQFLRRRYKYLMRTKSQRKLEAEQDHIELQNSYVSSRCAPVRSNVVSEVLKKSHPDINPPLGGKEEDSGRRGKVIREPAKRRKQTNGLLNGKKVATKKISWQDQMAMEI
ncbi:uncharacterized protein LOC110808251 isoform X2 [Carica papaya]|uniref:uncharacterized protein LOC110808251 isoform X2 n=1 Tax=Carica papaya TaxID=3649 RepID=UPI000B8CF6B4|nr:uncharacterized protein LOC110808251 isoform X2 [Carica papaya]